MWDTMAAGYTCGARIRWVEANGGGGGGVTLADACALVASEQQLCAPCDPRSARAPPPPPLAAPPSPQPCHVLAGTVATLGPGVVVCDSLRVDGIATVANGTRIDARLVLVGPTGTLEVGTPERPADQVVFYLRHDGCETELPSSPRACASSGRLISSGTLRVHGVRKAAWSLLTADCDSCGVLHVQECNGWSAGDRIVVAATGHRAETFAELVSGADIEANYWAERRTLVAVDAATCALTLDAPLAYLHRGNWLDGIVPTQAEVANLDRSVLITGPPIAWRDAARPVLGGRGLVTAQVEGAFMVSPKLA